MLPAALSADMPCTFADGPFKAPGHVLDPPVTRTARILLFMQRVSTLLTSQGRSQAKDLQCHAVLTGSMPCAEFPSQVSWKAHTLLSGPVPC